MQSAFGKRARGEQRLLGGLENLRHRRQRGSHHSVGRQHLPPCQWAEAGDKAHQRRWQFVWRSPHLEMEIRGRYVLGRILLHLVVGAVVYPSFRQGIQLQRSPSVHGDAHDNSIWPSGTLSTRRSLLIKLHLQSPGTNIGLRKSPVQELRKLFID